MTDTRRNARQPLRGEILTLLAGLLVASCGAPSPAAQQRDTAGPETASPQASETVDSRSARAPEQLSAHGVFSPACKVALYTSNRDGLLRPFLLDLADFRHPRVEAIPIDLPQDMKARALSADCRFLALVSDPSGSNQYDIYLYDRNEADRNEARLTNLTATEHGDEGTPVFSPTAPLLAYLADRQLVLHDLATGERRPIATPAGAIRTLVFSEDGRSLFLENAEYDLWRLDLPQGGSSPLAAEAKRGLEGATRVWEAPGRSYSPRTLAQHAGSLYFASDHARGLSQIYRLDLATGETTRVHPSRHDQFSPQPLADGSLVFRMNVDGSYGAYRLAADDVGREGAAPDRLSPERGVVYGLSLGFEEPLLLFAGESRPRSIYAVPGRPEADALRDLLPNAARARQPPTELVRNADGMVNLLFKPAGPLRGWVVWLHGGPHEQTSPRYSPYFEKLVGLGYGVAAMNYPGSTGIGNAYELRGEIRGFGFERKQIDGLLRDLQGLREREPGLARYTLLGVSSGVPLALTLLEREFDKVERLVDFSGVATRRDMKLSSELPWPPALFIYGSKDEYGTRPEKQKLVEAFERKANGTQRLVIEGEGHYINRRPSIDAILARLGEFLSD